MIETQEFLSVIKLNTEEAKKDLALLQKQKEALTAERKKALFDKDTESANRLTKQLKQVDAQMRNIKPKIYDVSKTFANLSSASVREVNNSLKAVNAQMKDMKRGTKEFRSMETAAKQLRVELAKVKAETAVSKSSWIGNMADWFNRMQGLFFSAAATIAGLSLTIRKSVSDFALMDQEMTNVQKYTGQTKEEVKAMNETFKKLNTRTPREKLNQLAGDAGRLGITTRKAVEEFVDGADKINVALGDDLGDDAVKNIGKLAMMFGEDKTKGLRGAMLATGSAVNELSQNSSAAAGYLVDYTARLAGVGHQAGITQQQIMGYASVLDQNMQRDEMAATAMQGLITKMFQEPAKFAKLAKVPIKEFSVLLKTDANKAILKFFEAMKAKGGFASLAPMFEKMKMDGARATGVLSVMANKLDDVKIAQDLANKAYSEGKSVIEEFNVQMSSEQAKLDMAKKAFKEISIRLGEELLPIARFTISTFGLLTKTLLTLINFVKKHIAQIITLTAAIVTLSIVYNAAAIKMKLWYYYELALFKLHQVGNLLIKARIAVVGGLRMAYFLLTGQLQKVTLTLRAMRIAGLANPFTAILTAVMALSYGIYKLISAWSKNKKAMRENNVEYKNKMAQLKDLADAQKNAQKSIGDEIAKVRALNNIVKSNVYSYGERKRAMIALEKIVPGYHRNLKDEKDLTEKNNKALKDYIENLQNAAMAKALFDKMVELQKAKFEVETIRNKHELSKKAVIAEINRHPDYYNAEEFNTLGYYPTKANVQKHAELKVWEDKIESNNKTINSIDTRIKNIMDYAKKNKALNLHFLKQMEYENKTTTTNTTTNDESSENNENEGKDGTISEEEANKRFKEMSKERKEELKREIAKAKGETEKAQAENILMYQQNNKSFAEFMEEKHNIAIKGYEKLQEINKKYGIDYGQMQEDIAKEQLAKEEDVQKAKLSEIERNRIYAIAMAKADVVDANSSIYHDEHALNERLFIIDQQAMTKKIELMKKGSEEWLNAIAEKEEKAQQHKLDNEMYYDELLFNYKEKWGKQNIKMLEKISLKGLKELHDKKLISEKEFLEMRKNIQMQYALDKSEQDLDNSKKNKTKKNAHTAYMTAANETEADEGNKTQTFGSFFVADFKQYSGTMKRLKKLYEQDAITYEEYQQAKGEAAAKFAETVASKMQAALDAITPIMNGLSSYYEAQSNYEQTMTEKKYDRMIKAAGNNSAKAKVIEEKKQKELAKIKSKYNKKAMKIELAQALATTAVAAINAYASAAQTPVVGHILGPIAAAMATAAGMLQVAAIKKQHSVEEAGYYKGGFTNGKNYRRKAGIVHEGEFVANHHAVENSNILPALQLIDQAQRNNTVGKLTAADVSRSLGQGNTTVLSAPTVNVLNNNEDLKITLDEARNTIEHLTAILSSGIYAKVYIDGEYGVKKNLDRFDKLNRNV